MSELHWLGIERTEAHSIVTMGDNLAPTPREIFGETLLHLRQNRGLSISALAQAAGISRQHVWRMEKGSIPSPGIAVLERLAAALKVSVSSLIPAGCERDCILNALLQHSSSISEEDFEVIRRIAEKLATGIAPIRRAGP